jgi:hypothetical protein
MIRALWPGVLISHLISTSPTAFARYGSSSSSAADAVVRTFIAFPPALHVRWNASSSTRSSLIDLVLGARLIGKQLGDNWDTGTVLPEFHWVIIIVFSALLVWYVWRHVRDERATQRLTERVVTPSYSA